MVCISHLLVALVVGMNVNQAVGGEFECLDLNYECELQTIGGQYLSSSNCDEAVKPLNNGSQDWQCSATGSIKAPTPLVCIFAIQRLNTRFGTELVCNDEHIAWSGSRVKPCYVEASTLSLRANGCCTNSTLTPGLAAGKVQKAILHETEVHCASHFGVGGEPLNTTYTMQCDSKGRFSSKLSCSRIVCNGGDLADPHGSSTEVTVLAGSSGVVECDAYSTVGGTFSGAPSYSVACADTGTFITGTNASSCTPITCSTVQDQPNAQRTTQDVDVAIVFSEIEFECNKGFGVPDRVGTYFAGYMLICQPNGTFDEPLYLCEPLPPTASPSAMPSNVPTDSFPTSSPQTPVPSMSPTISSPTTTPTSSPSSSPTFGFNFTAYCKTVDFSFTSLDATLGRDMCVETAIQFSRWISSQTGNLISDNWISCTANVLMSEPTFSNITVPFYQQNNITVSSDGTLGVVPGTDLAALASTINGCCNPIPNLKHARFSAPVAWDGQNITVSCVEGNMVHLTDQTSFDVTCVSNTGGFTSNSERCAPVCSTSDLVEVFGSPTRQSEFYFQDETVEIQCIEGYGVFMGVGDATVKPYVGTYHLICGETGEFMQTDNFACAPVVCQADHVPVDEHANYDTAEVLQYGGTAFYCRSETTSGGDGLTLSHEVVCNADGLFEEQAPESRCSTRRCNRTNAIGESGLEVAYAESAIEITCDYLYGLGGTTRKTTNVTCGLDGQFSQQDEECTKLECSFDTNSDLNATASYLTTFAGESITINCNQSYEVEGRANIVSYASYCDTETAEFISVSARCIRKGCFVLPYGFEAEAVDKVINEATGRYYAKDTLAGDSVTYICADGHGVAGSQLERTYSIQCLPNGTFANSQPVVCQPFQAKCYDPPVDTNAIDNVGSATNVGIALAYDCNQNFAVNGNAGTQRYVAVCKKTGATINDTMFDIIPTDASCEPVVCMPSSLPLVENSNRSSSTAIGGASIRYTCTPGYEINGLGVTFFDIFCNGTTGTFDSAMDKCEPATCGPSAGYSNGNILGNPVVDVGQSLTIQCEENYGVDGQPPNQGKFTVLCTLNDSVVQFGALKSCQKIQCAVPANVKNATASVNTTDAGSSVQYTCPLNYGIQKLAANNVYDVQCLHTGKLGLHKTCEKVVCANPQFDPNAERNANEANAGNSVEYTCLSGYVYFGNSQTPSPTYRSLCVAGVFVPAPGQCEKITCNVVDRTGASTSVTSATVGETVEYTCDQDYGVLNDDRFEPKFFVECMENGFLSASASICKSMIKPCIGTPRKDEFANQAQVDTSYLYTCSSNAAVASREQEPNPDVQNYTIACDATTGEFAVSDLSCQQILCQVPKACTVDIDGRVNDNGKCFKHAKAEAIIGETFAPGQVLDTECQRGYSPTPFVHQGNETVRVGMFAVCDERGDITLTDNLNCEIDEPATCVATADSRYFNFAGKSQEFNSQCVFMFMSDCRQSEGNGQFQVQLRNSPGRSNQSYTSGSAIKLPFAGTLELTPGNALTLNGAELDLPYLDNSGNSVVQKGSRAHAVEVRIKSIGVVITWSAGTSLVIALNQDSPLWETTCGLCGRWGGSSFKENPQSVQIIGVDQETKDNTTLDTSISVLFTDASPTNSEVCEESPVFKTNQCDMVEAMRVCTPLKKPSDESAPETVYSSCQANEGAHEEWFYTTCIASYCANSNLWCETFLAYEQNCRSNGVTVSTSLTAQACTVPSFTHSCFTTGDPHIKRFDGEYINLMQQCMHTMIKDNRAGIHSNVGSDKPFEIQIRNAERPGINDVDPVTNVPAPQTTYTEAVAIRLPKVGILELNQGDSVLVHRLVIGGEVQALPYLPYIDDFGNRIEYAKGSFSTGASVRVIIGSVGVTVYWNARTTMRITMDTESPLLTTATGICGKYLVDDANAIQQTLIASMVGGTNGSPSLFNEHNDTTCTYRNDTGNTTIGSVCSGTNSNATAYCAELTNHTGKYAGCHSAISPTALYDACVFDYCIAQSLTCESILTYEMECADAGVQTQESMVTDCGFSMLRNFVALTTVPATVLEVEEAKKQDLMTPLLIVLGFVFVLMTGGIIWVLKCSGKFNKGSSDLTINPTYNP